MPIIDSADALRTLYGSPTARSAGKEQARLDEHCRRFVGLSPFVVLSTQNDAGQADVSPRGDAPGFVHVADDATLHLPDRPGNNRLDSFMNLLERPAIAMLFLIPGVDETLRVMGDAVIRDDEALRAPFAVNGRLPRTVVVITVKQAFLHCAKALMRSKLWSDEARVPRTALPTMGTMLKDHLRSDEPAETQEAMLERYGRSMY